MKWFRKLIGTEHLYSQIDDLHRRLIGLRGEITGLRSQVSVTNLAFGKVIAKLYPEYVVSEHDPVRKAESDKLGNDVIQRLLGEDHYSNRTRGF